MTDTLRALARAKATFQARALEAVLSEQPKGKTMIRNDLLRKQLAKRPLVDRLEGTARNMRAAGDEDTAALLDDAAATLRAQAAEIERLRGELADGSFYKESDIDALQARAEKAEAERDTVYARGLEDAAKMVDDILGELYEHQRDTPARTNAANCLKFSATAIRALAPDPEER